MPEPNPILTFLADLTPWVVLGIAVLAIMAACKKEIGRASCRERV